MRRRDGLALAATGAIPDRVRAHVLAQHRDELKNRTRARINALLNDGVLPLPVPHGYRRAGRSVCVPTGQPHRTLLPLVVPNCPVHHCAPDFRDETSYGWRAGRAPARDWRPDHRCADTIWFMTCRISRGMTPTQVARLLNTDQPHPPLLNTSGQPRRWSARDVRTVLTDPVLTGHSVWGRTRGGRPLPQSEWMLSAAPTHPALLDPAIITRTLHILDTAPCPTSSGQWGTTGRGVADDDPPR